MQDEDYQSLIGNQVLQPILCIHLSSAFLQASLASFLELHTALLHLVQKQQHSDGVQQRPKQPPSLHQRPTDKERLAWLAAFRPHGAGLLSPIRPRFPGRLIQGLLTKISSRPCAALPRPSWPCLCQPLLNPLVKEHNL